MSRKTLADWLIIDSKFEASKQSITDFCRACDFSAKYFHAARSKLKQKQLQKLFVKLERERPLVKHDVMTLVFSGRSLSLSSSVIQRSRASFG